MIELHPEILKKNGKDEFVGLPYEEFTALKELLDDYEDLLDLRAAKKEQRDDPSIPLSQLKREFDEAEQA
jgi:hypothetical protein